jgi:hypothetical protein
MGVNNSRIIGLPMYEYRAEVSRGNVAGQKTLYKFGFNDDVDGTEEAIWMAGGVYNFPSDAAILRVFSDATQDDDGNDGARVVTIEGLDANYNEVSVDVTMDGTNAVNTTQTFTRVNRAFVKTAGVLNYNRGVISVVHQGTGTYTVATIAQTMSQTQQAIYTVPNGKTLYIDDINFTAAISQANKRAQVRVVISDFGGAERTRYINVLQSSQLISKFEYPFKVLEKSDICLKAVTDNTNNEIAGSFQGILIDN